MTREQPEQQISSPSGGDGGCNMGLGMGVLALVIWLLGKKR